jgi:hypothetical protein
MPTSDVTVTLTSSDTTEGFIFLKRDIIFSTTNWEVLTTLTVVAADDLVVDGRVAFTIDAITSSTDSSYADNQASPVTINTDDGITFGWVVVLMNTVCSIF